MRRSKGQLEDDSPGTPAWIVSFSDMVTLLLAFFVLLQAFAMVRDPELFYQGQGSFRRAIAGLGIPDWLLGKRDRPEHGHIRRQHSMPEDASDPARQRVLNARDEEIRLRFAQIKKNLEHQMTDVREKMLSVEATPIRFPPTAATLRASDRQFLQRFARELRQNVQADSVSIYVVGLARDMPGGKSQWLASARRALAVDRLLRHELKPVLAKRAWSLHSWGAGAGKQWCERLRIGTVSPQTAIVIAVMAVGDEHGRG